MGDQEDLEEVDLDDLGVEDDWAGEEDLMILEYRVLSQPLNQVCFERR